MSLNVQEFTNITFEMDCQVIWVSALLLLTPEITRLLKVSTHSIAPVKSCKCRRVRTVLLGSLNHLMGKGACVSQHGPIEHRAALAGTSLPVVQDACVSGSASLQTCHGGLYQVRGQGVCCKCRLLQHRELQLGSIRERPGERLSRECTIPNSFEEEPEKTS